MQAACSPHRHQAGAVGVARVPASPAVMSAAWAETCPSHPASEPWDHAPLALTALVLLVQSDSPVLQVCMLRKKRGAEMCEQEQGLQLQRGLGSGSPKGASKLGLFSFQPWAAVPHACAMVGRLSKGTVCSGGDSPNILHRIGAAKRSPRNITLPESVFAALSPSTSLWKQRCAGNDHSQA